MLRKEIIDNFNSTKDNINKVLKKCKSLVASFKHSEKLSRQLMSKQKELGYKSCRKLVQDVSTRWGSTHDLIESILFNKSALVSLSFVPGNDLNLPNEDEFFLLEDLVKILDPLKEITTVLSARNYVVITHLYPFIYNLINEELESISLVTDEVKTLKNCLIESLKKRFMYLLNDPLFKAITFLDSDYKKFEFVKDDSERLNHIREAKDFLIKYYIQNKENFNIISSTGIATPNNTTV